MLISRTKAALTASVALRALPVLACVAFTVQVKAADAPTQLADASGLEEIVVVGSGETRSVSTLLPSNLDVLPPGASVQKALNFLPA